MHVKVYEPTYRVEKDAKPERLSRLRKITNENIRTILEDIESLCYQGRNIKIASIQTNVSIEEKPLKKLKFEKPLHFSLSEEYLRWIFLLMIDAMLEDVNEQNNYDKLADWLTPAFLYIAYIITQKCYR